VRWSGRGSRRRGGPDEALQNGSSYIAHDLAQWIPDNGMAQIRGTPYHPMTQGKITGNLVFQFFRCHG